MVVDLVTSFPLPSSLRCAPMAREVATIPSVKISNLFKSGVLAVYVGNSFHLQAQSTPPPLLTGKFEYEAMPVLSAKEILRPEYSKGLYFTVRDQVPTNSGWNQYTIESEFGVYEVSGNMMLMRCVAEISAMGFMKAMSENKEFMNAVEESAKVPLGVAKNLVTNPGDTLGSVPKGIWGFLNEAGQSVSDTVDGRKGHATEDGFLTSISGFSKVKRDLALRLGVDPYSTNMAFQKALSKAARPIFLGKIGMQAGMSCVVGPAGKALFGLNMTAKLQNSLRDLDPVSLRVKNYEMLEKMDISKADADKFLNNLVLRPSTQTVIVSSLAELGKIPGRDDFIREAGGSDSELMAFSYQYTAEMMAKLNQESPITSIVHTEHLTVCQNKNGTMLIPLEWDYAEWSPLVEEFLPAVKGLKMPTPATEYSLIITGMASPTTTEALTVAHMKLTTQGLPGPLK